MNFET